jgi:hypothetical protein
MTAPDDRRRLRVAARRLAAALRTGRCPPDEAFDRFLPGEFREVSPQYWSPLIVAKRASEWLDSLGISSVTDIGSGVGKFCIAGALCGRCRFVGLEQDPTRVASARGLARLFGVDDRVRFVCGSFGVAATPDATAYYLFNPFADVDSDAGRSVRRYAPVVAMEDLLQSAPVGTSILTYNGFGGRIPEGYRLVRVDWALPAVLRLWTKEPK